MPGERGPLPANSANQLSGASREKIKWIQLARIDLNGSLLIYTSWGADPARAGGRRYTMPCPQKPGAWFRWPAFPCGAEQRTASLSPCQAHGANADHEKVKIQPRNHSYHLLSTLSTAGEHVH